MEQIEIRKAGIHELETIQKLALEIWPDTYAPVLSEAQIDYMLRLFYSEKALRADFNKQGYYFHLMFVNNIPAGYAGTEQKTKAHWHLHKIYLSQNYQGLGLGKKLISYVENIVRDHGGLQLTLNVNRCNPAQHFYKNCGYSVLKEEDIYIGSGFWMNDYIMSKDL
ncbi:MAG: GNAT family N-acetyltransferase [Niabella sp.]